MDVSQYAVGWGTLTLINAGIAQGKIDLNIMLFESQHLKWLNPLRIIHRSGLNWFLLTIFLGPLLYFSWSFLIKKPQEIDLKITNDKTHESVLRELDNH